MAKRWDFFERGDRAAKKLIWVVIAPERSWPMKLGEEKKEPDRAQLLFLRARWTDGPLGHRLDAKNFAKIFRFIVTSNL
jgi:hypothetical protein